MANNELVARLKTDKNGWNRWRQENPEFYFGSGR